MISLHRGAIEAGLIFEIAAKAGLKCRGTGEKRTLRCPFHDDTNASAFLSAANVFYCSVCTSDGGWSAKRFAEQLEVSWDDALGRLRSKHESAPQSFTPRDAEAVWHRALERAHDDERAVEDRAVYEYLERRSLMEAWEEQAFGVLGPNDREPASVAHWFHRGYRLIGALYELNGQIANVQARAIVANRKPKTMFPAGSKAKGTLFADARGIQVLRGEWSGERRVLLAEGLTDFLALVPSASIPVLSAPGTGMAVAGIGPWVRGSRVYLALDGDTAGKQALRPTAVRAYECGATNVARVRWPDGHKDACAFLEVAGRSAFERFLDQWLRGGSDA